MVLMGVSCTCNRHLQCKLYVVCGVVNRNVNLCYHCYLLMFVPFVGLALNVLMYSRNILEEQGLFK